MLQHLWLSGTGSCLPQGLLSMAGSMNKGCFSYRFGSFAQKLQEAEGEHALGILWHLLWK